MQAALGASYNKDRQCCFVVWAKNAATVDLQILTEANRTVALEKMNDGYFAMTVENIRPGTRYFYQLDKRTARPDPASKFQPEGVHGPPEVVDQTFAWTDEKWRGLPLHRYIVYEIHVGTYTAQGTFAALIPHLTELKELGITAIELMPVAQFPGERNWGYDGVYPFSAQNSYGGPNGLKQLVDACHDHGLAVILDVVYNHLGPEGNYLNDFAPYFTDRYKTPWGRAINFDGRDSDHVRRFFVESALYWITDFHIDGLRLDATDQIFDQSGFHFLEELAFEVHGRAQELNRLVFLFAETAANDPRIVRSRELGGYGLDAQWNDEFHHSLRTLLTGENNGYYRDYGDFHHLVTAYREGYVYSGQYSQYRGRRHGRSTRDIDALRFVVFSQNHDQVGNRMLGERLNRLATFEQLKVAAAMVLLSPFIPLLFMGEEYSEEAPFQYFISHSDQDLVEAVRRGRRQEFAAFDWRDEFCDPHDAETFKAAKLNHGLRQSGQHKVLRTYYGELIRLRKELPALARLSKATYDVVSYEREQVMVVRRWHKDQAAVVFYNFAKQEQRLALSIPPGKWQKIIDSAAPRWNGPGAALPDELDGQEQCELSVPPASCALFARVPDCNLFLNFADNGDYRV